MMVPAHQIHDLQKQIIEMRAMLEMMSMKMAAPIQQNIGQQVVGGHQIHNGTAIHINVFGQENVGHIGKREIRAILDEAQLTKDTSQAATQAMIKAAMLIYSDPDHPENLTCYMPNKKRDEALVYVHRETGPAWELQSCAIVGPPMTARALDTLCANQPFDNADNYAGLMRALIDNEAAYKEGREMRTILVRNKQLLERALGGGLPSQ